MSETSNQSKGIDLELARELEQLRQTIDEEFKQPLEKTRQELNDIHQNAQSIQSDLDTRVSNYRELFERL